MTIKKKIEISNVLMVLVPIAVSALTIIICLQTSLGTYWYSLEMMYRDEHGIQSAQSLIYTYQQELWENNWSAEARQCQNGMIRQSDTMHDLEKKLDKMGYHILVKKNGNILYSNISEEHMKAAINTAGSALYTAKSLTVGAGNISVIKNTFYHNAKEFAIIAISAGEGAEVESYLQNYIMRYILWFLVIFLLVTALINGILSRWISRSVLVPLDKLQKGARRIMTGNLCEKLEDNGKDEFGEVIRDFEKMRKYLKESVEQRLENEQRKKEMISGISHDLRTPLTSICGYVDGLLDGIADTPEKQKRYLTAIWTRTRDLERLVDSLSEYTRLDSGKVKYQMEKKDIKDFFVRYLEECEDEAKNKQVMIRFHADGDAYTACYDEKELKRVIDNLFTNTVKYREGEKSQVDIRLEREPENARIKITFADDGPGVSEESLVRIFDIFYRTDNARSHVGDGSGIGLAVVKEIISGHGGDIYAENDGGLSIIIKLPSI